MNKHESISVYDYDRIKLCDLYDSNNDLIGQAYDITVTKNIDGTHALEFKLPYIINSGHVGPIINAARYGEGIYGSSKYGIVPYKFDNNNFRWDYLKSDFLIRYTCDNKNIWFVASKPQKCKTNKTIYGLVSCNGFESLLKTRGIYKTFDDTNGIGTIGYIMGQILSGTGWTYNSNASDTILEKDGTTEKVRSLKSDGKKGVIDLITAACNLFQVRPIYDTDNLTVTIKSMNNRIQVLEGEIGRNLSAISEKKDASNIATRIYIEGEYGDYGYVGIDDVKVDSNGNIDPNGTEWGLPFLVNFDYYRKLGVFKQRHETALATYLTNIRAKKKQINQKGAERIVCEDTINELIGQCKLVVYYKSNGYNTPEYIYGDMTDEQQQLNEGDEVVILNNNMTCNYTTWPSNPSSVMSSAYGVAKFVTKASGKIGSAEVQIESKQKTIESIQRKINALPSTSPKIAEYQSEINNLQTEINNIRTNSLYGMIHSVMKSDGYLYDLKTLDDAIDNLNAQQDDIESDFIVAMGFMLRDGYWNNTNYVPGQEELLYADGLDMSVEMGKPAVEYTFNFLRVAEDFDIPIEDFQINAIIKVYDPELQIDDKMFIKTIVYGVDNKSLGKIDVSNQDITLTGNDLGSLLSRMSQLADLIDQKNSLYDRAKAINASGGLFTKRLEGQIDVLKTQLLSTVSNWYTDENGNIIFVAADESSAMMLCGAGFMIANSKDDQNNWNWRTFGTGSGFTADEIVAGFISAERIEAGSIGAEKLDPGVGDTLVITNNPAITGINAQIALLPDSIQQTVSQNMAPEFSTSTAYSPGDIVSYKGKIYKFTVAHSAGEWNASHVSEINIADGLIADTDNKLASYSTTTQTASQISSSIANALKDYSTTTQTASTISSSITNALKDYSTTTQTASTISSSITNALKDYSTTTQTATAISTSISSALGNYSTTTQTNTLISNYVTNNAYGKKSGVSINANQVKIESGSTYLLLSHNGMTFSGGNASLNTPDGKTININGFTLSRTKNYQNIYYYEMDIWNDSKHYFTLHSDTTLTSFSSYGYFVLNPNNQSNYSLRIKYDPNETSVCLYGDNLILGNADSASYHILSIRADYIYWYYHCGQVSSRDIKHNIRDMENVSQKISALNPVRFVYDADVNEEEQVGLIYEDVVNIIPEICFEQNGEKAIDYIKLVPFLLKEVQRLQNEIEELRR